MAWVDDGRYLQVVRVALRIYRSAVVNSDAPGQVIAAAALDRLKPGWLANEYADYVAAGAPPIR